MVALYSNRSCVLKNIFRTALINLRPHLRLHPHRRRRHHHSFSTTSAKSYPTCHSHLDRHPSPVHTMAGFSFLLPLLLPPLRLRPLPKLLLRSMLRLLPLLHQHLLTVLYSWVPSRVQCHPSFPH